MKKIVLFSVLFFFVFLAGCVNITFDFEAFDQQAATTTTTTFAVSDGTITYDDTDYRDFPVFDPDDDDLDTPEEITDVLMATQADVRLSNVKIETIIYAFPGVNTQTGSGVVFAEDENYYYVVSNYHVIASDRRSVEYEIHLPSTGDVHTAVLIAEDEELDLAALRFEKQPDIDVAVMDVTPRLNTQFNPGELILAVGNPGELQNNVTVGEFINMVALEGYDFRVVHHSASIHSGSSGGALVDLYGNFLGINTWGSDTSIEDSFAIPHQIVYTFLYNHGLL